MASKAFRNSLAIVSGMVLVASGFYAVNVVVFGEESDECSEQAEIARDEADSSGVAQIFSGSNAYDVGNYPALEGHSDGGAPVVWIANNPSFDDSSKNLYLLAYAWDAEDGWLGDSAFVWHSSLDGTVGADSRLTYQRKSPGCHVITVFATDSDGLVGVAKTVMRAGLPNTAPIDDDAISASLSERIVFDVAGNDLDSERNIDAPNLDGTDSSLGPVLTLLISGYIGLDGGLESSVVFDRAFLGRRSVWPVEEGDYIMELRDGAGMILREIPFEASVDYIEENSPESSQEENPETTEPELSEADFSVRILNPPDFASIVIKRRDGGQELFAVNRSLNTPVVDVSGVSAGQMFTDDDTINLSWTGTDVDGDSLYYNVYYSIDGGASYGRSIKRDTDKTELSIKTEKLPGSNNARFGVSVSDGLRSTFVETPVFQTANHAPEVELQEESVRTITGKQGFTLNARGYDIEDGGLFSELSWNSSIDGDLGTGTYLVLSGDQFTLGEHTITVTATDKGGLSSTDEMTMIIKPERVHVRLRAVHDSSLTAPIGDLVVLDVFANDIIDIDESLDRTYTRISSSLFLGQAEIEFTSSNYFIIRYEGHTSGFEFFEYDICTGVGRCHSATAVVAVGLESCTIFGTYEDDQLVGTSQDDVICGLSGDDVINGLGGNDVILAGYGDDTIYGDLGDDIVYGGAGNDLLLGHHGNDKIYGGPGDDEIYGGEDNDIIWGEDGADELYGEAGSDYIDGGQGQDVIGGGRGDDEIYGGEGGDNIRDNSGADVVHGGPGEDIILGTSFEDTVVD